MSRQPKLHTGLMEVSVAKLIGWRKQTIVPNVSWGLGLNHEADLLILDNKGRLSEIEIKISLNDLKADIKKWHGHRSKIISRLIYAVPDKLVEHALEIIPERSGLISVSWDPWSKKYKSRWVRVSKHDRNKQPIDNKTIIKLMNLGCMRIWSLKEKLHSKI